MRLAAGRKKPSRQSSLSIAGGPAGMATRPSLLAP